MRKLGCLISEIVEDSDRKHSFGLIQMIDSLLNEDIQDRLQISACE